MARELFLVLFGESLDVGEVGGHEVVGGVEQLEEVEAQTGQDSTLVRDCLAEDDVVRRDAIGGHEQEMVGVDLVDLPDFARCEMWECQHAAAA
jgi:hypothetical protein